MITAGLVALAVIVAPVLLLWWATTVEHHRWVEAERGRRLQLRLAIVRIAFDDGKAHVAAIEFERSMAAANQVFTASADDIATLARTLETPKDPA